MEPILITASIFATIYGIVYLSIRRKERMALLDQIGRASCRERV